MNNKNYRCTECKAYFKNDKPMGCCFMDSVVPVNHRTKTEQTPCELHGFDGNACYKHGCK